MDLESASVSGWSGIPLYLCELTEDSFNYFVAPVGMVHRASGLSAQ